MSRISIRLMVSSGGVVLALLLGMMAPSSRHAVPAPIVENAPPETPVSPNLPAEQGTVTRALTPQTRVTSPKRPEARKLDEASLLAKLHELAASDPLLSLQLARQAVARFPDSPHASEFEWNVVKSLANMERYDEARDEARLMVDKYPGDEFSEDVYRHLLNHPPNPSDVNNAP